MLDGGGLLALGGSEASCGYKGYGLAMLVEVFCGILAGAEFGPRIRFWKETDRIANLVSLLSCEDLTCLPWFLVCLSV